MSDPPNMWRRRWSPQDMNYVAILWGKDLSLDEIAAKLERTRSAVRVMVYKLGLTGKSAGKGQRYVRSGVVCHKQLSTKAFRAAVTEASFQTGVSPEAILSRSRRFIVAQARQLAIWNLRRQGHPYTEIGRRFGLDHTTCVHAYSAVVRRMEAAA